MHRGCQHDPTHGVRVTIRQFLCQRPTPGQTQNVRLLEAQRSNQARDRCCEPSHRRRIKGHRRAANAGSIERNRLAPIQRRDHASKWFEEVRSGSNSVDEQQGRCTRQRCSLARHPQTLTSHVDRLDGNNPRSMDLGARHGQAVTYLPGAACKDGN